MIPKELFEIYPDKEGRERINNIITRDCPAVSSYCIGKSMYGMPLDVLIVGNGGGRVAFFGAHHALEALTSNVLYAFVYNLSCASEQGKKVAGIDARLLLELCTFYVLPTVNPDGVELVRHGAGCSPISKRLEQLCGGDFSDWQANGRGVDLNHNYSFGFAEYKRLETERGITSGARLYSGEYPESEPESHSVAAFVRALAPSLVASLHSQGEEIYSMPRTAYGDRLGRRAAALCGYCHTVPSGTACFGGLCDYTGALGIPSLTVEVGRGRNPLPINDSRAAFYRILPCLARLPMLL